MPINIPALVDEYIESVNEEREPDGMYHPSQMFGCLRQATYAVRGIEPTNPPDAISKRRFYIGHRLHEAVQRSLESALSLIRVYPEFEINVIEHNITGHGDALVQDSDGNWWVIEVKSIKKWGMKMGLPKPDHVKQAKVYAWAVRNYGALSRDPFGDAVTIPALGDKLKGVIIVYVEKEELIMEQHELEWDDSWGSDIISQVAHLDVYRNDPDALPPRLPRDAKGKKNWMCNYCPFKDKCWKEDPVEIAPTMDGMEDW